MFKATRTHSGQYHRYGDSFFEWDIETDENKEDVLERCVKDFCHGEHPKDEWEKEIRIRKGDYGYYFGGWYALKPTSDGYQFTICHPFTD